MEGELTGKDLLDFVEAVCRLPDTTDEEVADLWIFIERNFGKRRHRGTTTD
jgi:hypothetical protein